MSRLGYLIRYRGWTGLIAGVAPFERSGPSPTLRAFAGNVSLVAGAFVVATGLLQSVGLLARIPDRAVGLLFVVAVVAIAPRLGVGPPAE